MLSFQKLDVYKCAVQFLARSVSLPDGLPRGHAALADQMRRAALSIPLNIAEGVGRSSEVDQSRFFTIARGSAMECAAIMDAFHILGTISDAEHDSIVDLLERIVSMLTKLARLS